MIRYKLTDQDGYTRRGMEGETRWQIGVTVHADSSLPAKLCTPGVIHGYETALLAVMMNPVHAAIENPRCCEIAVPEIAVTDGTKEGYRSATPIREISLPVVSRAQRVRFGILCDLEVYSAPGFVNWAQKWLSGEDRSRTAAAAAAAAAYSAAAYSAAAAAGVDVAAAVANAAVAAAVANAAVYAAIADRKINFAGLAERAIQEEAAREAARRPPRSKGAETANEADG